MPQWIAYRIDEDRCAVQPYPWATRDHDLTDYRMLWALVRSCFYRPDDSGVVTADTEAEAMAEAEELFAGRQRSHIRKHAHFDSRNNGTMKMLDGDMVLTGITGDVTGQLYGDAKRALLVEALVSSDWSQRDAAALLGITPHQVNYRVRKYHIAPPAGHRNAWRANKTAR